MKRPRSKRNQTVKIPWELYSALLTIQIENGLEFDEACLKVAELLDQNKEIFWDAVKREAQKLAKSQFMKQLNKARETIKEKWFEEGKKWVHENEVLPDLPCLYCHKPIYFNKQR